MKLVKSLCWLWLVLLIAGCHPAKVQDSTVETNLGAPQVRLTSPKLPQIAEDLITDFEVSSTSVNGIDGGHGYYDRHYRTATYPGGNSGPTVGIGVDLGQQSSSVTSDSWQSYLVANQVERFTKCAGVTGKSAQQLVKDLQDVIVPWKSAIDEFDIYEVPNYWSLTRRTFPGFDNLTLNCQGALVATVYNRGNSTVGNSRVDMRTLQTLIAETPIDYKNIANAFRHMEVTMGASWKAQGIYDGLKARYDATAKLAETPDN